MVDGCIIHWFASALSEAEMKVLDLKIGDAAAQQAVEALAVLVAVRAWKTHWEQHRAKLRVRSDSISALVLVLRLKTTGKAAGIIAREIALEMATAPWPAVAAEHIPGISNEICDCLSRLFAPNPKPMPAALEGIAETKVPARDAAYFVTMKPPANRQGSKKKGVHSQTKPPWSSSKRKLKNKKKPRKNVKKPRKPTEIGSKRVPNIAERDSALRRSKRAASSRAKSFCRQHLWSTSMRYEGIVKEEAPPPDMFKHLEYPNARRASPPLESRLNPR